MPTWRDATAMLCDAMRYGQGNATLCVHRGAFDEMKKSGNYLYHADSELLEYAHPNGTVWIESSPMGEVPEAQAVWTAQEPVEPRHENVAPTVVTGNRTVNLTIDPNVAGYLGDHRIEWG